jgi:hypothetical protein
MNWADARDNFVCGDLQPTGIWDGESYSTIYSKGLNITAGFAGLGANTVRIPVNVDTVTGSWWSSYQATIDSAVANGLNVIVSEWDECNSENGTMDTNWQAMWDSVVNKYGSNDKVFFEIFNEPYGYSTSAWLNQASTWIARYPSLPKGRIIVSGPGYNSDATSAGADSRFNGTLLSIHDYAFSRQPQTYAQWKSEVASKVGSYASRTVFTEFGTFMTTGFNFDNPSDTTNEVAYLRGLTDEFNALGVGSVYWAGLRVGDMYSMTTIAGDTQNGSGSSITMTVNNQSGLDRVQYGWRTGSAASGSGGASVQIRSTQSGLCLDVSSGNINPGGSIVMYTCGSQSNQRWLQHSDGSLVGAQSGLCLDVKGASTSPGAAVETYTCNGRQNQQWTFNANGTVTSRQSGLCLDVVGASTANGAAVDVWTCNGGANQKWTRVTPG